MERKNREDSGEISVSDDGSEDDGFEHDVQVLRNYSFISCDTDRTFEMHALVQLAMRKWLEANEQLEPWKQQYIKSLSTVIPNGEYENWAICQALFPHAKAAIAQRPKAEGSVEEWILITYNAAWYASEKGSTAEALQLSRTALEVAKNILGHEHGETLRCMALVASLYTTEGQWKEAEELQVPAVETMIGVYGEEHPHTLFSISELAMIYWEKGRLKEAEELQLLTVEVLKRVRGEEHLDTLTSISNLALIYHDRGRFK
ncbi:MAG: hypothetical protein L6R37_004455 [Teloschistes peruensis]|nr:MAG: hypothetical protein L6R37_004455 [Teloschistes peruensis]